MNTPPTKLLAFASKISPEFHAEVELVAKAIEHDKQITGLNLGVSEHNRVLRAANVPLRRQNENLQQLNARRKAQGLPGLSYQPLAPMKPYAHKLESWATDTIKRETTAAVMRLNRGPDEWKALIKEIHPLPLRGEVANIVWWDYFGNRVSCERWPHLDKYIDSKPGIYKEDAPPPAEDKAIIIALYGLGYTAIQAVRRITGYDFALHADDGADNADDVDHDGEKQTCILETVG